MVTCFAAFRFLTELTFIRPLVSRGIEPRSIYDAGLTDEEIAQRQVPREAARR